MPRPRQCGGAHIPGTPATPPALILLSADPATAQRVAWLKFISSDYNGLPWTGSSEDMLPICAGSTS
jgi:hypothetical protein